MSYQSGGLIAGSLAAAGMAVGGPEVPWWGELLMILVSAALAFFGGRVGAPR